MAFNFGRLIAGAGDVAQGMEDMTKLRQSNEEQALRLMELRRQEALTRMPAPDLEAPVTGELLGGTSLDKMDVEQVAPPAPPAQPAAPVQKGGLQTVPKAAPVTPEAETEFKKAVPSATVPKKEQAATYTYAQPSGTFITYNKKNFDFLADGPALLKPIMGADGKMNEQGYQASRFELLKQIDSAKQKMAAGGAFAGNSELIFYQNQLNYLDTTYNGLKRKGRVLAAPPVEQQKIVPEQLEKRTSVDTLGGYQLPDTQAKRLTRLQTEMPKQLKAAGTQALVKRAQEFGIDPAAAIAVYALENNYGGQAKSGAGAAGSMQVIPGTYSEVKKIFSDPNSVARLQIPPAMQQVAAGLPADMAQASPEQLRDAGLLYLYHLQNHRQIPTNMLGAAYHAGPNRKEFAQGLVPNTYDAVAKIWTPDHNAMYVALYNQYSQLSGGTVVAQPNAAPSGTQTIAAAMETPPSPAAPAAQPAAPAAAQPAAVTAAQPVVAGPVAAAATPGLQTQGTTSPQVAKTPSVYYAANPQAITGDMKIVQDNYKLARDNLSAKFERYRQAGYNEEAMKIRDQVLQLDNAFKTQAYYLEGMRGVYNLEYGNDPRGVASVMSFYAGQPVAFQPRSDGTFNMFVNGNKVAEGYTRDQVRDMARDMFDTKYRESKAAAQAKFTEMKVKTSLEAQMEVLKGTINLIKEKAIKSIEGKNALDLELLKRSGYEVKPLGGEGGAIIIPPIISGQPPFFFNPTGRTIEIDGIKVTSMSAYPIAGLPTLQTQVAAR